MTIFSPRDAKVNVRPYFHEGKNSQAPGSYWRWEGIPDTWFSAKHVLDMQEGTVPPFISENPKVAPGLIDVAVYGSGLSQIERPREPIEGEPVVIFGIPNGTVEVVARVGTIYWHRKEIAGDAEYSTPTWIVEIDELPSPVPSFDTPAGLLYQPVVPGMSGGPIIALNDRVPLGVLVGQSSPFDKDQDGDIDQFAEFHSLASVWDVFTDNPPLV